MGEEKNITKKKAIIIMIAWGILAFLAGNFLAEKKSELNTENPITDPIADSITESDNCNVVAFSIKGYLSTFAIKQPTDQEMDITSSEDIV